MTNRNHVLNLLVDGLAVVPSIWSLEVLNTLLVAERRKRITRAKSARFLKLLKQLPIERLDFPTGEESAELLRLARRHTLSAYDAAYLSLSPFQDLPIATFDTELMRAANQEGIPLLASS